MFPAYEYVHFNPRPREEGDGNGFLSRRVVSDFNPRPREEGDTDTITNSLLKLISIHALVKRAT